MNPPFFFHHGDHAASRLFGRGEMNMTHFCQRFSDCVVDRSLADFASLYVRNGNSQRHSH
jgi:hypothetical protein